MRRSRPSTRPAAPALAALALVTSLGPGLVSSAAQAAADGTCVGRGEYKHIHGGMTIQRLGEVLHGQTPFADTAGKGNKRTRWYVACEEWEPDLDVAVRYHQPVVGRRTVTKKALDVYVPV
jgi:hypothetical protein